MLKNIGYGLLFGAVACLALGAFALALFTGGTIAQSVGSAILSAGRPAQQAEEVQLFEKGSTAVSAGEPEVEAVDVEELNAQMDAVRESLNEVASTTVVTTTEVYSYTPGGESYGKVGYDVVAPEGLVEGDCFRVWEATNLEDLPWTALFCNVNASEGVRQQWPHPTELVVTDGIVEFDLYRDLHAVEQLKERGQFVEDPYDQALGEGKAGLGWFISGYNAEVCVNGECVDVSGGGTFQISFPRDFDGHYNIVIRAEEGQVRFWQGERVTITDNWPVPAE